MFSWALLEFCGLDCRIGDDVSAAFCWAVWYLTVKGDAGGLDLLGSAT